MPFQKGNQYGKLNKGKKKERVRLFDEIKNWFENDAWDMYQWALMGATQPIIAKMKQSYEQGKSPRLSKDEKATLDSYMKRFEVSIEYFMPKKQRMETYNFDFNIDSIVNNQSNPKDVHYIDVTDEKLLGKSTDEEKK